MRGKNKLFSSQINQELRKGERNGRGRSSELIRKRDIALMSRYYFYLNNSKLRYEEIIGRLSEQFFLSGHTVVQRLSYNSEIFDRLKKEKPLPKELDKSFPYMKWSVEVIR